MRSAAPVPHATHSELEGGYLRGCAKTEVALRDERSLSLRPRPAKFAAADRPHAKGPGPAVPTALDPVRGMTGRRFPATALVPDRSILLISPVKAGDEDRIQASFPQRLPET
jgi:hypothetical protein